MFASMWSYAQNNGTLRGRVFDQQGNPLAGVKVEVVGSSLYTQTLPDGTFVFQSLESGDYQLLFTHPDYRTHTAKVVVKAEKESTLQVSLSEKNPMLLTIQEEITVTAEADSIIDVSLPSHRTILPSSVLTELGTSNIAETVEKIPGIEMVGKGGYSMVPAIRGLAEHRILILMDGVRITSERRVGASASFVNLSNIDRIEVNRGPYSVFHGSGAIGGIINIVTKMPPPGTPFGGRIQLGYNTVRKEKAASLNLTGSWGKFGFMMAASGKDAEDYSSPGGKIEQSHYSDYDFMFKINRQGKTSQFYLNFYTYKGIDIGKPSPQAKFKPRWYPRERNTILAMGYKTENKFHLDNLNVSFYLFPSMLETQKENLTESLTVKKRNLARIEGTNFGFKLRGGKGVGGNHTINFGLDFFGRRGVKDKNTEWRFDVQGQITAKTEETSLFDARRNNFGIYIDDKVHLLSGLTMHLGARFDYINTSNLVDKTKRLSRTDESFTAYVGSVLQLTPRLSLLANVGRSFRFPTISELFYTGLTGRGTVFGSPDLEPEESLNIDLGFRYLHEKFYASLYGFRNTVEHMIQKYRGEGEEYYYRNLTSGHITGIEGEFYWWLTEGFELFVNFHHMKGKEKETDAPLNYTPRSNLSFWAKFSRGRFWVEPKINLTAAQKNPGPLEIETDGYTLFNAILGYKFTKNLTFLAVAQNILNQTYRLSADEEGVDAPGRGVVLRCSYHF